MSPTIKSYIMSPNLYNGLSSVQGFTDHNGKTYTEHICIIFKNKLTEMQKNNIKNQQTTAEALDYLKTIVDFTHDIQ